MVTLDEVMDVTNSMSTVAGTGTDTMSNNPQDALEEAGTASATAVGHPKLLRSRKTKKSSHKTDSKRHRRRRRSSKDFDMDASSSSHTKQPSSLGSKCCTCDRTLVRSTLSCMNILAKLLFWCSALASAAAVVWYSYELKKHGYVFIFHIMIPNLSFGPHLILHIQLNHSLSFLPTERTHI